MIYRPINDTIDTILLQNDLVSIQDLCEKCNNAAKMQQIQLNPAKYKVNEYHQQEDAYTK